MCDEVVEKVGEVCPPLDMAWAFLCLNGFFPSSFSSYVHELSLCRCSFAHAAALFMAVTTRRNAAGLGMKRRSVTVAGDDGKDTEK